MPYNKKQSLTPYVTGKRSGTGAKTAMILRELKEGCVLTLNASFVLAPVLLFSLLVYGNTTVV